MKNVQNLGFKANNKRNGKSYNEQSRNFSDKLERKATVGFKLRKQRQELNSFAY
jgi:hypothetical protein